MKLRKLTPAGIERFGEYLDMLQSEPARLAPTHLLEDSACSEIFGKPTEIQMKTFGTRYAAAEYLDEIIARTVVTEAERDVGLWAWLTLFFFNELCPPNKANERELREPLARTPGRSR